MWVLCTHKKDELGLCCKFNIFKDIDQVSACHRVDDSLIIIKNK